MKRRKKKSRPRPTKLWEKTIPERHATELLRDGSRRLLKMHTPDGPKWFVCPGGAVTDETARKILARPDVYGGSDGLFPGHEQTYRIGHR